MRSGYTAAVDNFSLFWNDKFCDAIKVNPNRLSESGGVVGAMT